MAYAENTSVSVEKSKAEIEKLLMRKGATQFVSGWKDDGKAMIQFRMNGRFVRFVLTLPSSSEDQFHKTPSGKRRRDGAAAYKAWEQACRSRWRALCLCIKAKLEAVDAGITTFETEFMPYTLMGNGQTVAEAVLPRLEEQYRTGKVVDPLPMLEAPSDD